VSIVEESELLANYRYFVSNLPVAILAVVVFVFAKVCAVYEDSDGKHPEK
jgi:hypothetical protein